MYMLLINVLCLSIVSSVEIKKITSIRDRPSLQNDFLGLIQTIPNSSIFHSKSEDVPLSISISSVVALTVFVFLQYGISYGIRLFAKNPVNNPRSIKFFTKEINASAIIAPMIAILILAVRYRVFALNDNKQVENYPVWIKVFMILSTWSVIFVGICTDVLVFLLTTKEDGSKKNGVSNDHITSSPSPCLDFLSDLEVLVRSDQMTKYKTLGGPIFLMRKCFTYVSLISIAALGIGLILLGNPADARISAMVFNIALDSILFFVLMSAVVIGVLFGRDAHFVKISAFVFNRFLYLIPMSCVLFMALRIRATYLQRHPPNYSQWFSYGLTGVSILTAIWLFVACKLDGSIPRRFLDFKSRGYRFISMDMFAVIIICAIIVISAFFILDKEEGSASFIKSHLQTALLSTIILCCLWFLNSIIEVISGLLTNTTSPFLKRLSTFSTETGHSYLLNLIPSTCILFMVCRLKALSLTLGQGAPQTWMNNVMSILTLIILAQYMFLFIYCVILPQKEAPTFDPIDGTISEIRLTGRATKVAAATMVSVCSVVGAVIMGGNIATCIGLIMMNPSNANGHNGIIF